MTLDDILNEAPYGMVQPQRRAALLPHLNELTRHHAKHCPAYSSIIDGLWNGARTAERMEDVPYLPVSLFKTHELRSVDAADVKSTLTSSGTSGQAVSKIFVDAETSRNQQRGLANSLARALGKKRLPMLVIDTDAVFRNPQYMSARGAGVLGMMRFGRDHAFALNQDLEPNFDAVEAFLKKNGGAPFFMFGFTYMVWVRFFDTFKTRGYDLSQGVLIHSGGWKKMIEQEVDNAVFRQSFQEHFQLTKIYNFYGMVEQLGSIFLEGPEGLLYPPNFSDIIIRNPSTFKPLPIGQPGVIQVVSMLAQSYPGHSLLTEDLGIIESVDVGVDGWNGSGIKVLGRVAKAELRGCSDVIAPKASA